MNAKQRRQSRRRINDWCRRHGLPNPEEHFEDVKRQAIADGVWPVMVWPLQVGGRMLWPRQMLQQGGER